MKRQLMIGLICAVFQLVWVNAYAQGPRAGDAMNPVLRPRKCADLEMLELSTNQKESLRQIETQYQSQILEYRQQLMVKRLELQDQLRNGDASEASIRKKSEELEETRRLLHAKMIDYQLHIRRMLTPDQLGRWCTMIGEPFFRGGWEGD